MSYHKRTECRLCGSTQLSVALHYPAIPLADEYLREKREQPLYPLDLYLCDECGAAQLLDIVSADTIYPEYTYETGSSPALVKHFRNYAWDVIDRLKLPAESLVVDIGSNDGTLLWYFMARGMKVVGVDPAKNISVKLGVQTFRQFFDRDLANLILHRHGPAKLITANNVYANIDDLRTFTENVRNLLADDGVFMFETFYLADLIDNMVFDFIYHEHVSAFAVAPLIGFFQRLGMQLFDVQRINTKGGSIRCYVQKEGGKRPVQPIVGQLMDKEYLDGIGQLPIYARLAGRIARAKEAFNNFRFVARRRKQLWAGYGASPTSTTLIYAWNMQLDFLVDDWKQKQGTFSPGLHLPVYGWGDLKDVDYCIILAWRYAEQIMKRNPQYRGTWIVPLPELRIIPASHAQDTAAATARQSRG